MDLRTAFWQLVLLAELPPNRVQKLENEVGSRGYPRDPTEFLSGLPDLTAAERTKIAKAELGRLKRAFDAGAFMLGRHEFPETLRNAAAAPPVLFGWGDRSFLNSPVVGIVGTRAATVYGKAAAHKFAEALTCAGVTIASGGALGIDASAHEAALSAGGKTVAVLPGGVDQAYPAVHRMLFKRIRERGLLISQFAVGAMPRRQSFLMRNALLAALCDAVLVVEAPEGSGSISAAQAANDLGRQVFVVPANITATNFRGSHDLIRSGATLVDHPDQILDDLGISRQRTLKDPCKPNSERQQRILGVLGVDPVPTETIAATTGLETSEVLTELTMLELDGMVIRAASGYALRP